MMIISTVLIAGLVAVLFINWNIGQQTVQRRVAHLYSIDDPQFLRTMGVLLGPSMKDGNRAKALLNGDEIFPAMLDAIRKAQRTVTFETYIYWSGEVGKAFVAALSERSRAGVKVHVLLDWVGSERMEASYLEQMKEAGVEVHRYNPLRWYSLGRINNRTHRKILVVDGKIGFTGGVGIGDTWLGHAQDPDHWRDTHFQIEGPVVAQMQSAFFDNWVKVTGNVLHGDDYYPPSKPAGSHLAQVFVSSPGGGSESMQLMYLLSIAAAKKSLQLSMAYFVPDDLAMQTLLEAIKRGVKIQMILPGKHTDEDLTRHASRAQWGELLRTGVEIYEYQPTMFHCKVMIVDGLWTSVGSTNFDPRSFRVNDEANLNIYDGEFAASQIKVFEEDLKRSRRITLKEWNNRPWTEKAKERIARLLRSQL
ncbi:MAG: cardiolipin synthase [Burkholderiales bacterium]|nr:cardiolipin synthase [Burkholderiales bacterium]